MTKIDVNAPIIDNVNRGIGCLSDRRNNPFASGCKNISRLKWIEMSSKDSRVKNAKKVPSIQNENVETIRFALISLRKPDGNLIGNSILSESPNSTDIAARIKNKRGLDIEACKRNLYSSKRQDAYKYYLNIYENALRKALEVHKARIVCINELGIPANLSGPLPIFFKNVKGLAQKYRALIIAGSCHDSRTKYNTGYIFHPNCPNDGETFHKQVSAIQRDINEHINVPSKRTSRVMKAFRLNIAVITCLDLMDYSIVASVAQMGDKLDFLMIPACSPKLEPLEGIATMISEMIPGGVGIINEYSKGKDNASCMYFFGNAVAREPDNFEKLDNNDGIINIYNIERSWFEDQKNNVPDFDPDLTWLLRYPLVEPA